MSYHDELQRAAEAEMRKPTTEKAVFKVWHVCQCTTLTGQKCGYRWKRSLDVERVDDGPWLARFRATSETRAYQDGVSEVADVCPAHKAQQRSLYYFRQSREFSKRSTELFAKQAKRQSKGK